MYDEVRITIEIVSALICFILVRFMIKPYRLTGEGRYLGLPLGFAFLGASYAISAAAFINPTGYFTELSWLQLLIRTFAFMFLAVTYFFSKQSSKNGHLKWNITLSLLAVALVTLLLVLVVAPQTAVETYLAVQIYLRVFSVFCLSYIALHTLRSHLKKPDPNTLWIPIGFILLAVSQYSLLFWYTDNSSTAFWGALVIRLMGLAVFLFVAYQTFYNSEEKKKDENSS
jgi:hypothetical protein